MPWLKNVLIRQKTLRRVLCKVMWSKIFISALFVQLLLIPVAHSEWTNITAADIDLSKSTEMQISFLDSLYTARTDTDSLRRIRYLLPHFEKVPQRYKEEYMSILTEALLDSGRLMSEVANDHQTALSFYRTAYFLTFINKQLSHSHSEAAIQGIRNEYDFLNIQPSIDDHIKLSDDLYDKHRYLEALTEKILAGDSLEGYLITPYQILSGIVSVAQIPVFFIECPPINMASQKGFLIYNKAKNHWYDFDNKPLDEATILWKKKARAGSCKELFPLLDLSVGGKPVRFNLNQKKPSYVRRLVRANLEYKAVTVNHKMPQQHFELYQNSRSFACSQVNKSICSRKYLTDTPKETKYTVGVFFKVNPYTKEIIQEPTLLKLSGSKKLDTTILEAFQKFILREFPKKNPELDFNYSRPVYHEFKYKKLPENY